MPTVITSFPIGVGGGGQQPNVHVRDNTIGADLYTRNENSLFEFAGSTTKLMTVLLLLDYKSSVLDSEFVTITSGDVTQPAPPLVLDMAGFAAGDVISLRGLLAGVLLPSGTDACQAIARTIGDYIYAQAGNTGNQGQTRFVEQMNIRATGLGLTNTTFTDPYGGSESFSPTVHRNIITAKDLSTLCTTAMAVSAIRTMAGTATYGISITGGRTTTLTVTMYNRFVNGPTDNQQGIKDTNVLGGKNGTWVLGGVGSWYSLSQIWTSPSGNEIVFTVLGSFSHRCLMLDMRGLMYAIIRDFTYLDSGTRYDDNIALVKMLVGADGSIADESPVGRTLTNTSGTTTTGILAGSTGALSLASQSATVTTADATDVRMAAADATAETWYAGPGTTAAANPAGEGILISKDTGSPNREFLCPDYFSNDQQIFTSTDGTNWDHNIVFPYSAEENNTFYNGALRHVAIVKMSGVCYIFINGERAALTTTCATMFGGSAPLAIGRVPVTSIGTYDEYRFTKGLARYTTYMVTLDPHKFGRAASPPPPPPPQTAQMGPQQPFGLAGGLAPFLGFPPMASNPTSARFYVGLPNLSPAGSAAAATAATQIQMPPWPVHSITIGPWTQNRFHAEGKNQDEHVAPAPPDEVSMPSWPVNAIIPGPWNHFGRLRQFSGAGFLPAPVVPPVGPPPPPPPPQSGVFGMARGRLPNIPRAPEAQDQRVRPHIDKVANLLNSLIRAGYIRQTGQGEWEVTSGAFVLPRAPVAADDQTVGAIVGGLYINTLDNSVYICTNNSTGSAVWKLIG